MIVTEFDALTAAVLKMLHSDVDPFINFTEMPPSRYGIEVKGNYAVFYWEGEHIRLSKDTLTYIANKIMSGMKGFQAAGYQITYNPGNRTVQIEKEFAPGPSISKACKAFWQELRG